MAGKDIVPGLNYMVRDDRRGQSNVIAVLLVFALALMSALFIASVGTATLSDSKQVAEVEEGVSRMTELDSTASLVALGGGDAASMTLSNSESSVTASDTGELKLVIRHDDGSTTVLTDPNGDDYVTLGTITYRNGDHRIAYQGGGVWRSTAGSDGSVMVSPPEVHYRQGTLTLPMIKVTSSERRLEGVSLTKTSTASIYPVSGKQNPVPSGSELEVTVTSKYYRAWGRFFEQRIGADVTYPADQDQTVKITLRSPESRFTVDSGLVSVGTSDRIYMTGSGGSPTFLDAYNSEDPNNPEYNPDDPLNATVRGKGGIKMGGNTYINGSVDVGDSIVFSGNDNTINGNASYQGEISGYDPDKDKNTITGWIAENGSGVDVPVIDGVVNEKVNSICDTSNTLSLNTTLSNSSSPHCHSGDLTIERGEKLTIDLSEGNVTLAVDGDLKIKGQLNVTNPGNNHTKLWLGGDEVTIKGKEDQSEGYVLVDHDKSPAFRLYGASDTTVSMEAHSTFQGLLYAPSTPTAGGGMEMKSGSELFGSAVVGSVTMRSGSSVHYDKALGGFTFDHGGSSAQQLSYLHVTINEIRAEER